MPAEVVERLGTGKQYARLRRQLPDVIELAALPTRRTATIDMHFAKLRATCDKLAAQHATATIAAPRIAADHGTGPDPRHPGDVYGAKTRRTACEQGRKPGAR